MNHCQEDDYETNEKLLAFVLAFAMIITIYQPSAVYAAKKLSLSAKTMTLQVGQKRP